MQQSNEMESEVRFRRQASGALGIDVVAPFEAELVDGTRLEFVALVRNFGGPSGMLVAKDYDVVKQHRQKIVDSGFGYATNLGGSQNSCRTAQVIDILKDWGWTGPEDQKPEWLD